MTDRAEREQSTKRVALISGVLAPPAVASVATTAGTATVDARLQVRSQSATIQASKLPVAQAQRVSASRAVTGRATGHRATLLLRGR
jgi:hypothetical protein